MKYMYFLFVADRYICNLITKVSGNFTHSSVQLFVFFFCVHVYKTHSFSHNVFNFFKIYFVLIFNIYLLDLP